MFLTVKPPQMSTGSKKKFIDAQQLVASGEPAAAVSLLHQVISTPSTARPSVPSIKKHLNPEMHHTVKNFTCLYCGKSFDSQDLVNYHVRRLHGNEQAQRVSIIGHVYCAQSKQRRVEVHINLPYFMFSCTGSSSTGIYRSWGWCQSKGM